jgi:hypothetical protein
MAISRNGLHQTVAIPAPSISNNFCSNVCVNFNRRNLPFNATCKFIWEHAFNEVENGSISLNYSEIVYSSGNVTTANCPTALTGAVTDARVSITISWLSQTQSLFNQNTNLATFVVYNTRTKDFTIATDAAKRADLSYVLNVLDVAAGDTLCCSINFFNSCSKRAGNSVCISTIELT